MFHGNEAVSKINCFKKCNFFGILVIFTDIINNMQIFFVSSTFINNARLKLTENKANAKQNPEDEILLFEIIHILHSCYLPKLMRRILKNKKRISVSVFTRSIIMKMKMNLKFRSHRYDIDRPSSIMGTNTVNIKSVSV